MDALHIAFGVVLILLTTVLLTCYVRIVIILLRKDNFRQSECYQIIIQQGVNQCLMAPYFIVYGISHLLGHDPFSIASFFVKMMNSCVKIEMFLAFALALNRLHIICKLQYPTAIHKLLIALAWLFGIAFFVYLLTPYADITVDVAHFTARLDRSKPYSTELQHVGFCQLLTLSVLTVIVYFAIFAHLLKQRIDHKLNAATFNEKSILLESILRFLGDFCLTVMQFDGGSWIPGDVAVNVSITFAYLANNLLLPPVLLVVLNRSIRRALFTTKTINHVTPAASLTDNRRNSVFVITAR